MPPNSVFSKRSLPFIYQTETFSNVNFQILLQARAQLFTCIFLKETLDHFGYHPLNTVLSYLPQPGRTKTEQAKGTSSFTVFFLVTFSKFRTEFSWLVFLLDFSGFWFFTQYLTVSSDHHPHSS